MATQHSTSRHVSEARRLLEELSGEAPEPQVKATVAVAHSILALAEQVAASRLILAADAAQGMTTQR
jgi:hypothetical protein